MVTSVCKNPAAGRLLHIPESRESQHGCRGEGREGREGKRAKVLCAGRRGVGGGCRCDLRARGSHWKTLR